MSVLSDIRIHLQHVRHAQELGMSASVNIKTTELLLDALSAAHAYIDGLPFEESAEHDKAIDAYEAAMLKLEKVSP